MSAAVDGTAPLFLKFEDGVTVMTARIKAFKLATGAARTYDEIVVAHRLGRLFIFGFGDVTIEVTDYLLFD